MRNAIRSAAPRGPQRVLRLLCVVATGLLAPAVSHAQNACARPPALGPAAFGSAFHGLHYAASSIARHVFPHAPGGRHDAPGAVVPEAPLVAPSAASASAFPFEARAAVFRSLIRAAARAQGIQSELLDAIVAVESGYDPTARSPAGAFGLMQLMPGTAAHYGVTDLADPVQNLAAGARHLRHLLAEFNHDLALALAAYNAGEYAVRRHSNKVPPYPETRAYVKRVLAFYQQRLSTPYPHPL